MNKQDNILRENNEMNSEKWNIIAKYLNKEELTPEEKIYIESAATDEELQNELKEATQAFEKTDRYFQLKEFDANSAWNKVNKQLDTRTKVIPLYRTLLRIAALFLLLLATGVAVWQYSTKPDYTTYTTNETDFSRPEIVLADGSKIILSHGSELKTTKKFDGNKREVELKGEAFFTVAKDAKKPFIIKTEKASIKVLGTSFNVNAYENESTVEVIVKTGKVQFFENARSGTNNSNAVILLPGEKGVYYKSEQRLLKNIEDNKNALAWMTHEIRFEFTSLSEVVSTLQHAYHISIQLEPNIDQTQHINASFNKQEIDYILDVVALTLDLQVIKNSDNHFTLNTTK